MATRFSDVTAPPMVCSRCEPGRFVVAMATRDAVTWVVRRRSRRDAAQQQEEASQAAHHLHQRSDSAADQAVPADSVSRSSRKSRTRRVSRTHANTGRARFFHI